MLIFPLKKQWYDKIKSGEKTVEYREAKPYWERRLLGCQCLPSKDTPFDISKQKGKVICGILFPASVKCYFQLGYKPETRLKAFIKKVEVVDGKNTDLKIDKPVYAIHFELGG